MNYFGDFVELSDYTGKPCRTKVAFEFVPNKKTLIQLEEACAEIEKTHPIEVKSKVLLMAKVDGKVVSLFPSGKILVRGEKEEEKAREIAKKVLKCIKA